MVYYCSEECVPPDWFKTPPSAQSFKRAITCFSCIHFIPQTYISCPYIQLGKATLGTVLCFLVRLPMCLCAQASLSLVTYVLVLPQSHCIILLKEFFCVWIKRQKIEWEVSVIKYLTSDYFYLPIPHNLLEILHKIGNIHIFPLTLAISYNLGLIDLISTVKNTYTLNDKCIRLGENKEGCLDCLRSYSQWFSMLVEYVLMLAALGGMKNIEMIIRPESQSWLYYLLDGTISDSPKVSFPQFCFFLNHFGIMNTFLTLMRM